jgi:hypothetical protein
MEMQRLSSPYVLLVRTSTIVVPLKEKGMTYSSSKYTNTSLNFTPTIRRRTTSSTYNQ